MLVIRLTQPAFQVNFVSGNRRLQRLERCAPRHPAGVVPRVLRGIVNDARRLRWNFMRVAAWVRLQLHPAARSFDRVLVERARFDAGHKQLPDATVASPHGVDLLVPGVEESDNAYHFGVRRPDGEAHPGYALAGNQMRAKRSIGFKVRAFAVIVNLVVGELQREAIGVVDLEDVADARRDAQFVIPAQRRSKIGGE